MNCKQQVAFFKLLFMKEYNTEYIKKGKHFITNEVNKTDSVATYLSCSVSLSRLLQAHIYSRDILLFLLLLLFGSDSHYVTLSN